MNKPILEIAADYAQRMPTPARVPLDLAAIAGGAVSIMGALTTVVGLLVALASLAWAGLRLHMMYIEWREWRKKRKS